MNLEGVADVLEQATGKAGPSDAQQHLRSGGPADLVGSEGVQERRDRQACCQPERFDLATLCGAPLQGLWSPIG